MLKHKNAYSELPKLPNPRAKAENKNNAYVEPCRLLVEIQKNTSKVMFNEVKSFSNEHSYSNNFNGL